MKHIKLYNYNIGAAGGDREFVKNIFMYKVWTHAAPEGQNPAQEAAESAQEVPGTQTMGPDSKKFGKLVPTSLQGVTLVFQNAQGCSQSALFEKKKRTALQQHTGGRIKCRKT